MGQMSPNMEPCLRRRGHTHCAHLERELLVKVASRDLGWSARMWAPLDPR